MLYNSLKKVSSLFILIATSTCLFAQTGKTLWGAESGKFPGEKIDGVESWKVLNNRIKTLNGGTGLVARRSYDKGFPKTWSESAMAADKGLCKISVSSFKPDWLETAEGKNDEAIRKYVQSIPDDQIVYLIFHHEPEDDLDSLHNTIPNLQKAFARFVDIVLSSGKKNVYPCFNLMAFTFKTPKRNPEDYNFARFLKPGQASKVVAGLDGYAHDTKNPAKNIFDSAFMRMQSWGFKRLAIFETSAHEGTTKSRKDWVNDLGAWVRTRPEIEVVMWFNSGNGPAAGKTGWYLGTWEQNGDALTTGDNDGSLAAFAELVKQNGK